MFKLTMTQAKGITMEVPEKLLTATAKTQGEIAANATIEPAVKIARTLKLQEFMINNVTFAEKTSISGDSLTINPGSLTTCALAINPLVKKIMLDIITPNSRQVQTNTIMDIMPIAAKVNGALGEGITNYLTGVVVVLTGVDEKGKQIAEFGSSHGILDKKIKYGMPGTPGAEDIIIRIDVVIAEGTGMERKGPFAAHQVCDYIIDDIRNILRVLPEQEAKHIEVFQDVRRPGKPCILIIKEVGGQGAMHEKLLIPAEPGGVRGARSIVDLGNVPVILSPNEVKDGAIHSMT